jgi:phosphatidylethanolamine/phosphatidyl-N-methylethanolamine N-methyltransferase
MTSDLRLFFREFRQTYRTTGAIAPSGKQLARALARFVPPPDGATAPRRVLEVGPGTGAVTCAMIERLGPVDTLDLVELNDRFVARLRERLATESPFQKVAARTQLFHQSVEDLPVDAKYDVIVSGLPLNNFSVELVDRLIAALMSRLAPGGSLSFFEYVWIRNLKAAVSGRDERTRLSTIGRTINDLLARHEFHRDLIWTNVPPAWVHHVRGEVKE